MLMRIVLQFLLAICKKIKAFTVSLSIKICNKLDSGFYYWETLNLATNQQNPYGPYDTPS